MEDFRVHLLYQCIQFVDGVQNFDAFGVWVEAHLEWTRHGRHPTTEFIFGIFKTLGNIVDGLVFLILVGLHGSGGWFESAMFALVADGMQEFAV